MHYVIAITPVQLCCSYRCAVTQHQCTAALVLAKCNTHCSVLLCKTGSQHALCHCNYTYAALMLIQSVHSASTNALQHWFLQKCNPHCSVLLCKTGSQHAPYHCNYTCAALLFIQVCSDPAPMHCSTGIDIMHSPLFSVALQNRGTACTMSLQ